MSTFGYRQELGKYEELDEEELLATLSSEELQELERELADIDPDDDVPIGLRQKDQTAKIPTGNFSREALLKYWQDESKKLMEGESVVTPSSPGQDNGEVGQRDKNKKECVTVSDSDVAKDKDKDKRSTCHKEKKNTLQKGRAESALHKSDRLSRRGNEEEKKDMSKKNLPPTRSPQKKLCNAPSRGPAKEPKKNPVLLNTAMPDQNLNVTPDRPCGNPVVIDQALEQILRDDPSMCELNLNNVEDVSQEVLLRFAEALGGNTHVRLFSLANTHADDRVAFAISKMLQENRSILNLNIESNFVSGRGILALLMSLRQNCTLVELRFQNQRHICGGQVEMEMVPLLRENTTLLKLGYQFDLPGPRMSATSILTRNQDQQRQRRLQQQQQKKEQARPEATVHAAPTGQVSSGSSPATGPTTPTKKSSQTSKTTDRKVKQTQNKNPPPPPPPPPPTTTTTPALEKLSEKKTPTRKIAEMIKQREGTNGTKNQPGQKKPKSKRVKNGANEKESADILKELKNALKPSPQKKTEEPARPLAPQRSSRDDLMAAIRGSSIGSLKRVDVPQH